MMMAFGMSGNMNAHVQLLTVDSSTSAAQNVTAPAGIAAGDLMVLQDRATGSGSNPSDNVPSGFTPITTSAGGNRRMTLSYKLAVGNEGGTSITGLNGAGGNNKVLAVYKFNLRLMSVALAGVMSSGLTDSDPAAQVTPASAGTLPILAVGVGSGQGAPVLTMTPTEDDTVSGNGSIQSYKLMTEQAVDVQADVGDTGSGNFVAAFYFNLGF